VIPYGNRSWGTSGKLDLEAIPKIAGKKMVLENNAKPLLMLDKNR
jgi:hypothetical protein